MHKRAEVPRARVLAETSEHETRQGSFQVEADEEEAFIIRKVGVIFGPPLFNQFTFEEQGFGFGFYF